MKTKTLDLRTLTVGVLSLAVALAFVPFVPTAQAATFSIYSDVNVDVVGVYNKALGGSSFVDLSLTPMAAVRAQEPKPYPTGYVSEGAEVTNSVWDNGVSWDFEVNAPSADWIWETERAEGPAGYGLLDPLYDADASKYGRVVVFERTFDIGGVPTLGNLHLTADNAYEVWVNGTFVTRSVTAKLAGWETSNLHEANVGTSGWQTVGSVNIEPYLAGGENTLTILAGNEYFFTDDGNAPVPALQSNPYKQYNPGAMIFALDVEYDVSDIDIVKEASSLEVFPGETVDYTYTVTNPGATDLGNVVVIDDTCDPVETVDVDVDTFNDGDLNEDGLLNPGETWTFTCSMEIFDETTNIGTVTADDPEDYQVTDDDDAVVATKDPGCTLTQGYWKTHSINGPAPTDPVWGGQEGSLINGLTWYDILWTSPSNGDAWYILAHQYIAALLNIDNGAGVPTEITDAIADAADLLDFWIPSDLVGKTKTNKADRADALELAGILANFNEGGTVIPHCSEI